MYLRWHLGASSAYTQSTTNSWINNSAGYDGVTGQTNLISTNGATFYITGVQLELGATATAFEYRDFGRELMMCQRYFCSSFGSYTAPADGSTSAGQTALAMVYGSSNSFQALFGFTPVDMRTAPSITVYAPGTNYVSPIQTGKVTYYNGSAWAYPTGTVSAGVDNAYPRMIRVNTSGLSSVSTGYCLLIAGGWAASAEL
jgi:hypothetical protein